jgi:hypothetical protein
MKASQNTLKRIVVQMVFGLVLAAGALAMTIGCDYSSGYNPYGYYSNPWGGYWWL